MTWFKRHWVDALMVALIVTVIGGVLALVLRGTGNGASSTVTATQPLRPAPNPSTTPPTPSRPVAPPSTTQSGAAQSGAVQSDAAQSGAVTSSQPAPAPAPSKPVEIAAIPPIDDTTVDATANPAAPAARVSVAAPPPPARAQPAQAQREPLNYGRADFLRNYRVAIATYTTATRAQSSAARLRSLGYPAQAFSSGAGFIVVAGPYARESSARKAFDKLRAQGYSDAVLYSPNGNRERSASAAQPVAAPTTAPSATPPAGGDSTPVRLDPGLSYLQVGAFKTMQSALPLLERLRGSGFKTLLRSASDGYTRVLVGPFSPALLGNAKQNLSGQGLTAFAVKQ